MANPHPFIVEMGFMLTNLDRWLGKAADHAGTKKFDPENLAGKEAPAHADDEKTFAEMRARIVKATSFLDTLSESDFEGAETRKVALPFIPGGKKGALGLAYLVQFAQPNFFFHLAHAYAILRHNGVELGKIDYIGGIPELLDM